MTTFQLRLCSLLVGISCLSFNALPQSSNYAAEIGTPVNAALVPVQLGTIDLSNGNLLLNIPLATVPQRNHAPLTLSLTYNSTFWDLWPGGITGFGELWYPQNQAGMNIDLRYGGGVITSSSQSVSCPSNYPNGSATHTSYYAWVDPDGTQHSFGGGPYIENYDSCRTTNGISYNGSTKDTSGYSVDGTGYFLSVVNYKETIYGPDGSRVSLAETNNGNYIDRYNAYPKDTRGPLTISNGSYCPSIDQYQGNPAPNQCTWTVQTWDGAKNQPGSETFTFIYSPVPICSAFNSPGSPNEYCATLKMLTRILLPDNTHYDFTYDSGTTPGHYGTLTGITLPTGGQINYGYYKNPDARGYYGPKVSSVSDSGGARTINYAPQPGGGTYSWINTLTGAPRFDVATNQIVNDKTVFYITAFGAGEIQYYSGQSTLLKTVNMAFDTPGRTTSVQTTWNQTAQSSQTIYKYADDSSIPGAIVYGQPGIRLVAQRSEYGFDGALYRTTSRSYLKDVPGLAYVSQYHIINRPMEDKVTGAGNTSDTLYTYDEYSANYCKNGISGLSSVMGAPGHDDTIDTNVIARGNATTVTSRIDSSHSATVHMCYDTLGNVTQTVDARGHATTVDYKDSWQDTSCIPAGTQSHVAPTTVTDALGHQTKLSYYSCTGLAQKKTDENGQSTTTKYTNMNQLYREDRPDGGWTAFAYDPVARTIDEQAPINSTGTSIYESITGYDQFGRLDSERTPRDPYDSNGDSQETTYDATGQLLCESNWHRSTPAATDGNVCYNYDALGRKTKQTQQDGGSLQWSYSGSTIDAFDEAGHHHQLAGDALGRLIQVKEPDPVTNSPTIETDYQYDVLDNLIRLDQWGGASGSAQDRVRSFSYDSLSRLLSETTPEAGTITYAYDLNGNLTQRLDARNIAANWAPYDSLNRPTGISYTDGSPSVSYAYDTSTVSGSQYTVGRLTSETVSSGATVVSKYVPYAYDQMGRVLHLQQCTPANCSPYAPYALSYTYDVAGDLLSSTNGIAIHPVILTYNYDTLRNLASLSSSLPADVSHPPTLFSAVTYGPEGFGLTNARLGKSSSNQATLTVANSHDNRHRPLTTSYLNNSSQMIYSFSVPAGIPNQGYSPNSSLLSFNDSVMGNWTLLYDDLNRIKQGTVTFGTYNNLKLSWGYDTFGNRTQQTVLVAPTASVPPSTWATFNTSNRVTSTNTRPAGFVYDAAGNVLTDGLNQYVFDAAGRLCAVQNMVGSRYGYVYDAEGRRIAKGTLSTLSCNMATNGFKLTSSYVLGPAGEQVSEADGSGNWVHTNVYAGGALLATYYQTNTYFALNDWLGTKRGQYSATGVQTNYASLPFGDNLTPPPSSADATEQHFTSFERDQESGLDHTLFRQYSSGMARWLTPDPYRGSYDLSDPQSFNRYSYGGNSPLTETDPSGLDEGIMWDVSNSDATGTAGAPLPGTFPAGEGNNSRVHPCPGAENELCEEVTAPKFRDPDLDMLRAGSFLPSEIKGHSEDQIRALLPEVRPLVTIQAGGNLKEKYCSEEMLVSSFKDATGLSLLEDLALAAATASFKPLTASDGADFMKEGAEAVANHKAARAIGRQVAREAGFRVSEKAMGKGAKLVAKRAGLVGIGLVIMDARDNYQGCMHK